MENFQNTLTVVGDISRRLSRRDLRGLSDIGREFEAVFFAQWQRIELGRRRAIMRAMVDLSEDNVDFDFKDVFSACLEDTDAEIRHGAVDGLWDDDRPRTMRQLLTMFAQDDNDDVRATAALALGRFAYRASLDELRPADVAQLRAALVGAARDPDLEIEVRRRALESAGYFHGPDVDEAIAAAYASGNSELKQSALAAIGHSLDQRWLPILRAELAGSDPALLYEAAHASGELADQAEALVPLLFPLIESDDVQVYGAAIWALGQIGGDAAKRVLRRIVAEDDSARQEAASEALGELEFNVDPGNFR